MHEKQGQAGRHSSIPLDISSTVFDPVCGMTVNPETAAGSMVHRGKWYYFCHPNCLRKFQADPESFIDSKSDGMSHPPRAHTKPAPQGVRPRHESPSSIFARWTPKLSAIDREVVRSAAWRWSRARRSPPTRPIRN